MGTLFGYVSIAAKDMSQGKTPPDPRYAQTWERAMLQGLTLNVLGDVFFEHAVGLSKTNVLERLTGPAVGEAVHVVGILTDMAQGDFSKAGKNFAKTVIRELPFVNLWFLGATLNYLVLYYIKESLDPGSVQKMQDDLEKKTGNRFVLPPSEYANLPK